MPFTVKGPLLDCALGATLQHQSTGLSLQCVLAPSSAKNRLQAAINWLSCACMSQSHQNLEVKRGWA